MNAWRIIPKVTARLALLVAITVGAQPEQWLKYHTGADTRGYRWLEISTNAPAEVALPKVQPGAWFGCWSNGLEPGPGRWFCLDRTRKSGPCDRLFFDADGNGRLDDETPVAVSRRDNYSVYFEPVKVIFQGEDGPVSYHLKLRALQYAEDRTQLLANPGCWYEGKVKFGDKTFQLRLEDNTVNGTFNNCSHMANDCDRVILGDKEGEDRYLGRYLEVEGDLYAIEVTPDGAFVRVTPANEVAFGMVQLPEAISTFAAVGENGHFVRQPQAGRISLPLGRYRVYTWTIERKDDRGQEWRLAGSGIGPLGDFEVTANQSPELAVGEPVRPALQANEAKNTILFSLRLMGLLGETVDIQQGDRRPRAPQLQVASLDGSYQSTRTFEYG